MIAAYLRCRFANCLLFTLGLTVAAPCAWAQEVAPAPTPVVPPVELPPLADGQKPYPINLPTAMQLAHARAIDIALASERIRIAAAQLDRAKVLWLPTLLLGADYYRHDGQIQDIQGNVFGTSRTSMMVGGAPYMVFALADALFAPLAARQVSQARQASLQAATNDTLLVVAETYFNVQQARGELAGAVDVVRKTEEVARRAKELAPGIIPPVEEIRVRTELARRRQVLTVQQARWRTTGAELVRLLRLDPTVIVDPVDPPNLKITLLPCDRPVDDLIPIGLSQRPELASQQALVKAALARLRQERIRPLVPSILLRGTSTQATGTLAAGFFGGGLNSSFGNFGVREDFDLQALWELQNFGLGNRARVRESEAERKAALMELFRTQDRVAAEIVQAHAEVQAATARLTDAETEVKDALDSYDKNLEGLGQTRRAGNLVILVIRPQEVVAAIQALGQAYGDYYGTVADYNRAQFRLYRALGQPGQSLMTDPNLGPCEPVPTGTPAALPPAAP